MNTYLKSTTASISLIAIVAGISIANAETTKTAPAKNTTTTQIYSDIINNDMDDDMQLGNFELEDIHSALIENEILQKIKASSTDEVKKSLIADLLNLRGQETDMIKLASLDDKYQQYDMAEMMDDEALEDEMDDEFDEKMDEEYSNLVKKYDSKGDLLKQASQYVDMAFKDDMKMDDKPSTKTSDAKTK